MREVYRTLILQLVLFMLLCLHGSQCSTHRNIVSRGLLETKHDVLSPDISPSMEPQPLLPFLAPSPLMPFTNNVVPQLSGLCSLKFSDAKNILSVTATDCWNSLAPYLANVICCPQFDANLAILIAQSSISSGKLALNVTHARHCLSDVEQILEGQGANENLHAICSIYPSNLTEGSCPVVDVKEIDRIVDSSRLFTACEIIDPINECCNHVCQNAISDAAEKIALKNYGMVSLDGSKYLTVIKDCNNIVLRWLASKFDVSTANSLLRGLSSCKVNNECPLVFPDMRNVSRECGNMIMNKTGCCDAMEIYVSYLQEQSFITNLQALNCAALLAMKLQEANVFGNVYDLCHINLKDFSLQVESKDTGCLLPSLPSDVTYDKASGIGFICDLNDNVAAPWPSTSFVPAASSCNRTITLPALPKATSAQNGLHNKELIFSLLLASLLVLKLLL